MKQYHVLPDGDVEHTPSPHERVLADGRRLKSALKSNMKGRPWEEEADVEVHATPAGTALTKKRVRIRSRDNMVHVFEPASQLTDQFDDEVDEHSSSHNRNITWPQIRLFPASRGNNARWTTLALAAAVLLGWAVTSSWLIFVNRDIMKHKGFPFPLMLPAVSQLGCAGLAWGAGAVGVVPVRPWPPLAEYSRRMLPLILAVVFSMFLGNYAYLGLSLTFLNMLKAFTPAATLLLSTAVGMESFTPAAFMATVLIAFGTGVATAQETAHNTSFHWPAFISFTTSIAFEAIRVVCAAKLLGDLKNPYNPVEMMAHMGPGVFAMLGGASLFAERTELVALGRDGLMRLLPDLILVIALSFLVNATSFYAIMYTSSTTFKVVGCFKNAAVVSVGVLQGDKTSTAQLQGFAVAIAGFLLYTWSKSKSAQNGGKDKAS